MLGIVDYGAGNLRSVQKALEAIGERALVSGEPSALDGCDKLILPGVGSFGAGMAELSARGLDSYIKARAADTKILGICLGMQFLLEKSFEEGEFAGLGLIPGQVVRFTEGKIPQIGWNEVHGLKTPLFAGIAEGTRFYFVHSYRADCADEFACAKTEYYIDYPSAIWRGNVFGVQFHPEKSGDAGLKLLKNFCKMSSHNLF